MTRVFFFFLIYSSICFSQTSLKLNEIMFYPVSGNNEFIEIYNTGSISIDLYGFGIKYYNSSPDFIIGTGQGTLLEPLSYAVVFEADYDIESGIYNNLIPPGPLILKITDNYFGSTGMANTSDRPVWLLSANDDTLDVYTYSADNPQAHSDEKILVGSDSSQINWLNSGYPNGTPGFQNSVTPVGYDLEIKSVTISPLLPFEGDNILIISDIKNGGENAADNFTVMVYNDVNLDSIPQAGEEIYSQEYSGLQQHDSLTVVAQILSASSGFYNIIAEVVFPPDEDTLDNTAWKSFSVYPPGTLYNDIVINEIMYAPASEEPEWVEIYNQSSDEINLKGWKFSDYSTSRIIIDQEFFISPGGFMVLTRDSSVLDFYDVPSPIIAFSLPALNNTGDAVVIKDSLGLVIDSLIYSPDWGGAEGRSLERISVDEMGSNEDNWLTCESIFRATPGQINSVTPKRNDLEISGFETSEYAVIGDPARFKITIKNAGLNTYPSFSLLLYYDINEDSIAQSSELTSSVNSGPLFSGDTVVFNLFTSNFGNGQNYFIATVIASPDNDMTNNTAYANFRGMEVFEFRNDLVINEFMYDPVSPQPEWIEILNRSSIPLDLKNHKLADSRDTITFCVKDIILPPGGFALISDDSTITNYFNVNALLMIKSFSALNNSGDKIILLDSMNRVIDSLEYSPDWGGGDGFSLERIDADSSASETGNWRTSISRYKATPGYVNSVTSKENDLCVMEIISSPPYPVFGDDVSLLIKIKNPGLTAAPYSLRLYEDTDLDSLPDILLANQNGLFLSPGDSAVIDPDYIVSSLFTARIFYAEAIFTADMDTSNNYSVSKIYPGYPQGTIVINEVMYYPEGGEPEWVEFYNKSDDSICLKDWSFSDVISSPSLSEIDSEIFIPSHNYFVIARDSSILQFHRLIPSPLEVLSLPVLNNDADGFVLKDPRGQTMDSLFFTSTWGGRPGHSLERVSVSASTNLASNWGSSEDIEFGTPGRINSITPKNRDIIIDRISSDPEFPVEGNNVFITAMIKNKGKGSATGITAEFYIDSDSNSTVDRLISSQAGISISADDSLFIISQTSFNNLSKEIRTAVRVMLSGDEDTLNNYRERVVSPGYGSHAAMINEIMYDPAEGEPEWFEIVNTSADSINIRNWSAGDTPGALSGGLITDRDSYLKPGQFAVIAKDTSFNAFHPEVSSLFTAEFGNLGNSGDYMILYDFRGGIIDSIHYQSSWGGKNGYSLERIDTADTMGGTGRWASSISSEKSTPGKGNSLSGIPRGERSSVVINEIMSDPGIDNCEFVEFYNNSSDTIDIGGWTFEESGGKTFRLSESYFKFPSAGYYLLAADSAVFSIYSPDEFNNFRLAGTGDLGLSNAGELILLKDVRGNIIDSLVYSSSWHNRNIHITKNKSLERINPALTGNYHQNWSTSVDYLGATPGRQNSIFTENNNRQAGISVSPNPFSPDNDGYEDFCIINYTLSQAVSQIRIKIFDSRGRLVRTVANNMPSASQGSVIFDGLEDSGIPLRIGIYIVFLEALNDNAGVVENLKTVVVAARKL